MHKLKNFSLQSKIFTVAIAAVAIILIISCQKKPADMENIPDTPIPEVPDTAENEQIQYSDTEELNEDPLTDKNIVNIMLIGQDKRSGEEENSRSDSMIIATVNKKNNSVKLISLMRDMYVNIPDYGYNKINAAYAFGGMDLLDNITTNLTNTQILSLVTRVALMDASDIGTYRIPADGTFTPDTIYDMSVLVPDLTANRELIKEYMGY